MPVRRKTPSPAFARKSTASKAILFGSAIRMFPSGENSL